MTGDDELDVPRVVTLSDEDATRRVRGAFADVTVLLEGADAAPADAWLVLDGAVGDLARFDVVAPPPAIDRVPAGARVLAYHAHGARSDAPVTPARGRVDPGSVQGNAFAPAVESPRVAIALVSIAGGRRMDAGPESERAFLVLEGSGLVFLQNDTTLPFKAGDLVLVPAGEPARVWSRGPGDVRLVALQPQTPPVERRSLRGEIEKRRAAEGRDDAA